MESSSEETCSDALTGDDVSSDDPMLVVAAPCVGKHDAVSFPRPLTVLEDAPIEFSAREGVWLLPKLLMMLAFCCCGLGCLTCSVVGVSFGDDAHSGFLLSIASGLGSLLQLMSWLSPTGFIAWFDCGSDVENCLAEVVDCFYTETDYDETDSLDPVGAGMLLHMKPFPGVEMGVLRSLKWGFAAVVLMPCVTLLLVQYVVLDYSEVDCQGLERYLCVPEMMKFKDAIFPLLMLLLYFEAFEAACTDCWCWGCADVAK
ncbi:hypothetical protein Nepgr_006719 [Nepenthes gracilis]|uniref:Uncharacterized protein n=1 Tax=Nepenthes gracilis TaxID=150966 RepID=A0AAD3S5K5_NEPGR|nr:hypothetical protein Nepgr_006719 [Nepenthes gracilis]